MKKGKCKPEVNGHADESDERFECESADQIREEKLTWLLPNRLLARAVNILEGQKGAGKSTFSAALVGAISTGKALWGKKRLTQGATLWLPGEEDVESVVVPRLRVAGADLSRVRFMPKDERGIRMRPRFPADLDLLEEVVMRYSCALVVIDPLSAHVPASVSLKDDQAIHEVLDPIASLAHATGATVIVNRNLTKNTRAARIDRGLGGAAVGGVARSILCVERPELKSPRRVLRVVAGNLSDRVPLVEYTLEVVGDYCRAAGFVEMKLSEEDDEMNEEDVGERDAKGDARRLLEALLKDRPVAVKAILNEALTIQVSPRTLRSVKAELGIKSRRVVKGKQAQWYWLPIKKATN